MSHYRAVLFDWVGTLVHYQRGRWRLRRAHENLRRTIEKDGFEVLVEALKATYGDSNVQEAMLVEDCSPELHRVANMMWFERAGLDTELAEALYAMDFDPATHPVYPESRAVLSTLHALGIRNAVITNFHRDIRPAMASHGFTEFVDAVVISAEHGFQKPNRRMFTTALDLLGVDAGDTLMVGDNVSSDGAAGSLGIDTLILPMPATVNVTKRGLDAVVRLVG